MYQISDREQSATESKCFRQRLPLYQISDREQSATRYPSHLNSLNCIRSATGSNPQPIYDVIVGINIVSDQRPGAIRNPYRSVLVRPFDCIRSATGSNPQHSSSQASRHLIVSDQRPGAIRNCQNCAAGAGSIVSDQRPGAIRNQCLFFRCSGQLYQISDREQSATPPDLSLN